MSKKDRLINNKHNDYVSQSFIIDKISKNKNKKISNICMVLQLSKRVRIELSGALIDCYNRLNLLLYISGQYL
jgi:hypothetical protein